MAMKALKTIIILPEQIIPDLERLVVLNEVNLWAKVKELIILCH